MGCLEWYIGRLVLVLMKKKIIKRYILSQKANPPISLWFPVPQINVHELTRLFLLYSLRLSISTIPYFVWELNMMVIVNYHHGFEILTITSGWFHCGCFIINDGEILSLICYEYRCVFDKLFLLRVIWWIHVKITDDLLMPRLNYRCSFIELEFLLFVW